MTLDYTNLDVFFHMANHYRKIRNAKSVIDCSPPKGCNQNEQSRSSRQQQCKVPQSPCSSNQPIRNDECYKDLAWLCPNTVEHKRSCSAPPRNKRLVYQTTALSIERKKSPTRPKSVQPSVKRTPANSHTVAKSTKKKSSSAKSKSENPQKSSEEKQKKSNKAKSTKKPITCREPSCPDSVDKKRMEQKLQSLKTCNQPGCSVSKQKKQVENAIHGTAVTVPCNKSPCCAEKNKKTLTDSTQAKKESTPVKQHEYLYFMLRITEDILRNNKYTVDEMEEVFKSHFDANKGRLDETKMREHIDHLKKHLNYPVCICDEKAASDDDCHCCPTVTLDIKTNKPGKCSCEDPRCATNKLHAKGEVSDSVSKNLSRAEGEGKKNVTVPSVVEKAIKANATGDGNTERKSKGVVNDSVRDPTKAGGGGEKNMAASLAASSAAEKATNSNAAGNENIGKKSEETDGSKKKKEPGNVEEENKKSTTAKGVSETKVTGPLILPPGEPKKSTSVGGEEEKADMGEHGVVQNRTEGFANSKTIAKTERQESIKDFNECINPVDCGTKPGNPTSLVGKGSYVISEMDNKIIRETAKSKPEEKLSEVVFYNPEVGSTCHCAIALRKTALKIKTEAAPENEEYILVEGPVCMPKAMLEEKTVPVLIENVSSILLDSDSDTSVHKSSRPAVSNVNLFRRSAGNVNNIIAPKMPESISDHIHSGVTEIKIEEYDMTPQREQNKLQQNADYKGEPRRSIVQIRPSVSYYSNSRSSNDDEEEEQGEEIDYDYNYEIEAYHDALKSAPKRNSSAYQWEIFGGEFAANDPYPHQSKTRSDDDFEETGVTDKGDEKEIVELFNDQAKDITQEKTERVKPNPENSGSFNQLRTAPNNPFHQQLKTYGAEETKVEEKGTTDKEEKKGLADPFHNRSNDITQVEKERPNPKPKNASSSNLPQTSHLPTVEDNFVVDGSGRPGKWEHYRQDLDDSEIISRMSEESFNIDLRKANSGKTSESRVSIIKIDKQLPRSGSEILYVERALSGTDRKSSLLRKSELEALKSKSGATSESSSKLDEETESIKPETIKVDHKNDETYFVPSFIVVEKEKNDKPAKTENAPVLDPTIINYPVTSVQENQVKPDISPKKNREDSAKAPVRPLEDKKDFVESSASPNVQSPKVSTKASESPGVYPEISTKAPKSPVQKPKDPVKTPASSGKNERDSPKTPVSRVVPTKASVSPAVPTKTPVSPAVKTKTPVSSVVTPSPASCCLGREPSDQRSRVTPRSNEPDYKTAVARFEALKPELKNVMITKSEPAHVGHSPNSSRSSRSCVVDKTHTGALHCKTGTCCPKPSHKDVPKAEPTKNNSKVVVPFVVPSSQRPADDLRNKYHFLLQDASTSVTSADLRKAEEDYYRVPMRQDEPQPEPEPVEEPKPYYALEDPEPVGIPSPITLTMKTPVPESHEEEPEVQGDASSPPTPRRSVQLHLLYEAPKTGPAPAPVHHDKRQSILVNPLVEDDYKLPPDSVTEIHPAKHSTDTECSGERNLPRVFEYTTRGQKKPMVPASKPGEKYFEYAYQRKHDSLTESLDVDRVSEMESITKNSDLDNEDYLRPRSTPSSVHASVGSASEGEYPVKPQESEDKSEFISETSILMPKNKEVPRVRYSLNPEGYDHEEIIRRLDEIPEPDRTPNQLSTIRKITQKLEDFRKIDPNDINKKFQYSNPENFEIRRASLEDMPANFDPRNAKKQKKACCGLIQPTKAKKMVPRRM